MAKTRNEKFEIIGPGFSATVKVRDGKVIQASEFVSRMNRWTLARVTSFCRGHQWTLREFTRARNVRRRGPQRMTRAVSTGLGAYLP